jgi:hypothetical protein
VWAELPGYQRLQRALKLAEDAAFVPAGLMKWANRIRPPGEPEVTEADLLSAGEYADALERLFRGRVEWWGG